jgi:hypothetical protein
MRFEDLVLKFDPETMITAADGKSARGKCPAHDGKSAGSLSITKGANGRAQLHCFGGCTVEEVLAAVGIDPVKYSNGDGCTLNQYSEKTGLPVQFLRQHGLSDGAFKRGNDKIPAVVFPYYNEAGEHLANRYRIAADGSDKFRWAKGTKASQMIFGVEHIHGADPDHMIVVEGESDVLTCSHGGFQTLGLPGAGMLDTKRLSVLLGKIETVYFVIEPDRGGDTILQRLSAAPAEFKVKLRLLSLGDHKDPNELFKTDPENFVRRFKEIMAAAPTLEAFLKQREERARAGNAALAADLISCQDILGEFAKDVKKAGLTGEERNARLLYLAVTSRLTAAPVNVVMQGPSAAGKSYTAKTVLKFFPPYACIDITSLSERALIYFQEPLCHRMIFIAEAPGMDAEFLNYIIRTLLSEKQIVHLSVQKGPEGQLQTIEQRIPGPTGMITTTTRFSLHPENATRSLFVQADDSPEQTARIVAECFEQNERQVEVEFERWHALQDWLAGATLVATIPFREAIYRNIPPAAVRLRRDAGVLQILISAHAILHQKSRNVDARGRVVATLADYAAVHELVADLIAEQASTGTIAIDLEFFDLVRASAVQDEQGEAYVTTSIMVRITKKSLSWILRCLGKLAKANYLAKDTTRPEHRFYIAENLPGGAVPVLPSPEVIERWIFENSAMNETVQENTRPNTREPSYEVEKTEATPFDGMAF